MLLEFLRLLSHLRVFVIQPAQCTFSPSISCSCHLLIILVPISMLPLPGRPPGPYTPSGCPVLFATSLKHQLKSTSLTCLSEMDMFPVHLPHWNIIPRRAGIFLWFVHCCVPSGPAHNMHYPWLEWGHYLTYFHLFNNSSMHLINSYWPPTVCWTLC